MAVEIERKWVAPEVPAGLLTDRGETLRQGYLTDGGAVTVRLRVIDDLAAVLTIKADSTHGGAVRAEVEAPIGLDDAEQLWPHTAGRRIAKRRHRVAVVGGTAEVDVYEGELDGLCTVEVEFGSIAEASEFTAPDWFGREVTGDERWSNASLAQRGRPAADG